MQLERTSIPFDDESARDFVLRPEDTIAENFKRQFFYVYRVRISHILPRVEARAATQLGKDKKLTQLQDMKKGEYVFVAGTILKKMQKRPSVLYEFAEDDQDVPEFEPGEDLTSDDDILELEDDRQVVKLRGNIDASKFTTGFVMGFYGHQIQDNYFEVEQVIFPVIIPQVPWPLVERDSYVVFASGLNLTIDSRKNTTTIMGLNLFCRWIAGEMYFCDEEQKIIENISRIIFAGESMSLFRDKEFSKATALTLDQEDLAPELMEEVDAIFSRFSRVVPIDLMPGKGDPTNDLWPMQPIPRVIFQNSVKNRSNFRAVTNPYKFKLANIDFIGTSGENVLDMLQKTRNLTPLDIMQKSLECGLSAPTAPDSIDTFPFPNKDPFVLDELPHVFFAGNQDTFDFRMAEMGEEGAKVFLLAIPKFSKTFSVCLLNLRNMSCVEYNFTPP